MIWQGQSNSFTCPQGILALTRGVPRSLQPTASFPVFFRSRLTVPNAQPSLISIHDIIMAHIIFLVIIMKLTLCTLIMCQALC